MAALRPREPPRLPLTPASFLLVLRTLVGHKANICSLDFHPYGEFVASGSQDTNIKVRPCTGPRVSRWPGSGTGPCVRPERVGVSSLSAAAALLLKIPSFSESSPDPCHLGCNDLEVPRALLCSQPHTALQPGPQDGPGSRPPQPQPPLVVTCSDSAPLLLSPQLWDIRRKGCVFRYRVRKAPSAGHHAGLEHEWFPGRQGQEGTAGQHGENTKVPARNMSPEQSRGALGGPPGPPPSVSPVRAALSTLLRALVLQAANKCHQAKGLLFRRVRSPAFNKGLFLEDFRPVDIKTGHLTLQKEAARMLLPKPYDHAALVPWGPTARAEECFPRGISGTSDPSSPAAPGALLVAGRDGVGWRGGKPPGPRPLG